MKLSITSRLTITSAVLTALVFIPAALALYSRSASGIRMESARNAEAMTTQLSFSALSQWDEDLMVEYTDDRGGADPLQTVNLHTDHWALVRGSGRVVRARGMFEQAHTVTDLGGSSLVEYEGGILRTASAPLFQATQDTFESLPEPIRKAVRKESQYGKFLRVTREIGKKKGAKIEVAMLEPDYIVEVEFASDGTPPKPGIELYDEEVPTDLFTNITDHDLELAYFSAWKAYNGQLIAVLEGKSTAGEVVELVLNRLGERFILAEDGEVHGPDPDWRLWVVTATDAESEIAALQQLRLSLAVAFPLVWGLVVIVSWYVTRRALSPVSRIVRSVEKIELSSLDGRLPIGDVRDELSMISETINRMLDRIQDAYQRERQFTGDASHELRGPLAKLIADIDVSLSQYRESEEYRETLIRCRKYGVGMQRLVEALLWLARFDAKNAKVNARPFEIKDLLAQVVGALPQEDARRVRLDLGPGNQTIHTRGDPELVRVLIQNLVLNSIRYSPPETPVSLRLRARDDDLTVEIQDQGDGIPEEKLERVFSRFYRVDKSRSRETGGSGLGLAIVHEIAAAHELHVTLRNVPSSGLIASVTLPLILAVDTTPEA